MKNVLNLIRGIVRPIVTVGLVGATIFAALKGDLEAVESLGVLTGTAMAFWFSDRNGKRDS